MEPDLNLPIRIEAEGAPYVPGQNYCYPDFPVTLGPNHPFLKGIQIGDETIRLLRYQESGDNVLRPCFRSADAVLPSLESALVAARMVEPEDAKSEAERLFGLIKRQVLLEKELRKLASMRKALTMAQAGAVEAGEAAEVTGAAAEEGLVTEETETAALGEIAEEAARLESQKSELEQQYGDLMCDDPNHENHDCAKCKKLAGDITDIVGLIYNTTQTPEAFSEVDEWGRRWEARWQDRTCPTTTATMETVAEESTVIPAAPPMPAAGELPGTCADGQKWNTSTMRCEDIPVDEFKAIFDDLTSEYDNLNCVHEREYSDCERCKAVAGEITDVLGRAVVKYQREGNEAMASDYRGKLADYTGVWEAKWQDKDCSSPSMETEMTTTKTTTLPPSMETEMTTTTTTLPPSMETEMTTTTTTPGMTQQQKERWCQERLLADGEDACLEDPICDFENACVDKPDMDIRTPTGSMKMKQEIGESIGEIFATEQLDRLTKGKIKDALIEQFGFQIIEEHKDFVDEEILKRLGVLELPSPQGGDCAPLGEVDCRASEPDCRWDTDDQQCYDNKTVSDTLPEALQVAQDVVDGCAAFTEVDCKMPECAWMGTTTTKGRCVSVSNMTKVDVRTAFMNANEFDVFKTFVQQNPDADLSAFQALYATHFGQAKSLTAALGPLFVNQLTGASQCSEALTQDACEGEPFFARRGCRFIGGECIEHDLESINHIKELLAQTGATTGQDLMPKADASGWGIEQWRSHLKTMVEAMDDETPPPAPTPMKIDVPGRAKRLDRAIAQTKMTLKACSEITRKQLCDATQNCHWTKRRPFGQCVDWSELTKEEIITAFNNAGQPGVLPNADADAPLQVYRDLYQRHFVDKEPFPATVPAEGKVDASATAEPDTPEETKAKVDAKNLADKPDAPGQMVTVTSGIWGRPFPQTNKLNIPLTETLTIDDILKQAGEALTIMPIALRAQDSKGNQVLKTLRTAKEVTSNGQKGITIQMGSTAFMATITDHTTGSVLQNIPSTPKTTGNDLKRCIKQAWGLPLNQMDSLAITFCLPGAEECQFAEIKDNTRLGLVMLETPVKIRLTRSKPAPKGSLLAGAEQSGQPLAPVNGCSGSLRIGMALTGGPTAPPLTALQQAALEAAVQVPPGASPEEKEAAVARQRQQLLGTTEAPKKLSWWERQRLKREQRRADRDVQKDLRNAEKAASQLQKQQLEMQARARADAQQRLMQRQQQQMQQSQQFGRMFPGAQQRPGVFGPQPQQRTGFFGAQPQPQMYGAQQQGPGLGQRLQNYFSGMGQAGVGALMGLGAQQPGAMFKTQQAVVVMERQRLQELQANLTELMSLLGAEQVQKIMQHTKRSVINELDRMCLRKGWALFNEASKTCVPIVGAFAQPPNAYQQFPQAQQARQPNDMGDFRGAVQKRLPPVF